MNVCHCPDPPGGFVECRNDQLAVCGYEDGKIRNGCYDKPDYISFLAELDKHLDSLGTPGLSKLVLCNWIISTTTGSHREDITPIEDSHLAMLRTGQYENRWTGEVLKFSLPKVIQAESWRLAESLHFKLDRDIDPAWPGALDLSEWTRGVAELSRRLEQVKGLAEMNRALAQLKGWYKHVVSAGPQEISRMMAEMERETARRYVEATSKRARVKRWMGAGKRRVYLSGLRGAREDFAALWVKHLQSSPAR